MTTGKEIQMAEIRFELPADDLAVMDAYIQAKGGSRTSIVSGLIRDWSASKEREAIMILRVLGRNPNDPAPARSRSGSES